MKKIKPYKFATPLIIFLGLVLPFLTTYLVSPEWLGRVIAITVFYFFGFLLLVWILVDPRADPPVTTIGIRLYEEKPMKKIRYAIKGFIVLLIAISFPLIVIDQIKDINFLLKNGEPLVLTDKITRSDHDIWSCVGTCIQGIKLESNSGDWTMYFHFPALQPDGKTYEFLYVPNSKSILDVKEVL